MINDSITVKWAPIVNSDNDAAIIVEISYPKKTRYRQ